MSLIIKLGRNTWNFNMYKKELVLNNLQVLICHKTHSAKQSTRFHPKRTYANLKENCFDVETLIMLN